MTFRTAIAAVPETVAIDGLGWKVQHFGPGQGATLGRVLGLDYLKLVPSN